MKLRISTILLSVCMMMGAVSCIKEDNYPGPDATLEGNLVEEGKGANIQTCTGNVTIRLEQLNWSETPAPQDIPIKPDGSFKNSKLFAGHYRVSIKGGAFWPVDPVEMDIKSGSKQDFSLTPYVVISNLTHEMVDSTTLKLTFDMIPPVNGGLPQVIGVQPYVNTTSIVGPGASIFSFSDAQKLKDYNANWEDLTPEQKSPTILIKDLIKGRTFFVRVGVKFNNDDKSSNLSEVIQVDVP